MTTSCGWVVILEQSIDIYTCGNKYIKRSQHRVQTEYVKHVFQREDEPLSPIGAHVSEWIVICIDCLFFSSSCNDWRTK